MIKKRYIIVALATVSVLLGSLLVNNIILAQTGGEYDPWMDLNDDGIIDVHDLRALVSLYGTLGTPINKTELLLELEARIDSLNASLLADYYDKIDCDSLFALLAHMHSGSDISGGTLGVDEIRLGSAEGDQVIYFYNYGSYFGEYISWWDSPDVFFVSDDIYVGGTIKTLPTTRYYTVPATAWLPYRNDYVFYRELSHVRTLTAGETYWLATVNLPHGAVVTELRACVYDNDGADGVDVSVDLARHLAVTSASQTMANVSSSGAASIYQEFSDATISYANINNQNYAYFLIGRMMSGDNNHRLSQVRITYTIDEPLP